MKAKEREKLEENRVDINAKAGILSKKMKEAEFEGDWDLAEKIDKELDILSRRQKYILWKLGLYKFSEDEVVEYEPGKFMEADKYYWLMVGSL